MSNKPMLSVERELLEIYVGRKEGDWVEAGHELRALLDKPTQTDYLESCAAAAAVFAAPAAHHHGDPVAYLDENDKFVFVGYEKLRTACWVDANDRAIPNAWRPVYAELQPGTDVRKILLAVVPGEDGEGEEVYAKSVADVEALLSTQGECIEELESELANLRAAQQPSEPVAVVKLCKAPFDPVYLKRGVLTGSAYSKVEVGAKLYAVPQPTRPFSPDTVVCRRYTLEQSPGQNFYHYEVKPVYGSVPVTLSDLISMAEGLEP